MIILMIVVNRQLINDSLFVKVNQIPGDILEISLEKERKTEKKKRDAATRMKFC